MRRALAIAASLAIVALASACGRAGSSDSSAIAPAPDAEVRGWEIPDGKVPFEKPKVPVPDELRGVWHLPSARGAIDLELHEDQMVVWRYNDCVCVGGSCARWQAGHGAVEVRADYGWRLYWPTGVDAKNIPRSVELRFVHLSVKGDELTATFDPLPDGGAPAQQVWKRGGVCPKCRPAIPGPLPDGPPVACAPDFMFCPLSNSADFACH